MPTNSSINPSSSGMLCSLERGDGMIIIGDGAGDLTTVACTLCDGVVDRLTGTADFMASDIVKSMDELSMDLSELLSEPPP